MIPSTLDGVYHWALVVADFDAAAVDIAQSLGIHFAEAVESSRSYVDVATGRSEAASLRVSYSRQGPPYLELIQVLEPGGPFTGELGIHHLGVWCKDVAAVDDALVHASPPPTHCRVLGDGSTEAFALLTASLPSLRTRVEYVSVDARPVIESWTSTGIHPS